MPPVTRPATRTDLPQLIAMSMALYAEHPGPQPMDPQKVTRTMEALERNPSLGMVHVIEDAGKVVGYFIAVDFWSNEYGGMVRILDELYLVASARNGGMGAAVMEQLEQQARTGGVRAIFLEVDDDNPRAFKFYQRRGFVPSPRHHVLKVL